MAEARTPPLLLLSTSRALRHVGTGTSSSCGPRFGFRDEIEAGLSNSHRGSYHRQMYRLRNTTQKSLKDIQKALSVSSFTRPRRARRRRVHSGDRSPQSPLHSCREHTPLEYLKHESKFNRRGHILRCILLEQALPVLALRLISPMQLTLSRQSTTRCVVIE